MVGGVPCAYLCRPSRGLWATGAVAKSASQSGQAQASALVAIDHIRVLCAVPRLTSDSTLGPSAGFIQDGGSSPGSPPMDDRNLWRPLLRTGLLLVSSGHSPRRSPPLGRIGPEPRPPKAVSDWERRRPEALLPRVLSWFRSGPLRRLSCPAEELVLLPRALDGPDVPDLREADFESRKPFCCCFSQ